MTIRSLLRRLVLVAPVLLCGSVGFAESGNVATGASAFTAEQYIEHIRYLAGDSLRGRRPGSEGMAKAEVYIANHFAKLGLKPLGEDESYFQSFELRREKRFDATQAEFSISGVEKSWVAETDWTPMSQSPAGTLNDAPIAFVGYGIDAVDDGYTDYDGFDVTGKIALMLRYEPKSEDKEAKIGGSAASTHATFQKKASVAADKGALAVLIVNPPLRKDDEGNVIADKLMKFDAEDAGRNFRVPFMQISREMADAILAAGKMPTLAELQEKIDRDRKAASADIPDAKVSVKTGITYAKARNVIALLEGTSAKDEYVVIGGHHDHLGNVSRQFGGGGGSRREIHNGADDNASGTAGVLELARVFASGPRPRRSIIFMTFSAEEMGLLGSAHFVKEPTVPLEKIVAMVNFDMIGRLGQDDFSIYGTDTAEQFAAIVEKAAAATGLKYSAPTMKAMTFGDSDHSSFFRKGIPVLFPFTGVHKQYHKPEDDWERIDAIGATTVLQTMAPVIHEIANLEGGPTYVAPKKEEKPAEESASSQPSSAPATGEAQVAADRPGRGDTPMPRVRLGVMPSYSDAGPGLLIESVVENGQAAKGGMKDGDRIVKIEGKDIGDIQDYMSVLRTLKAGDEITIVVERGTKREKTELKLTLTAPTETQKPS
ncbi:MAG: M20/M25/M40 family metallo-hydrolase [Phycisphaerae bacterium]